MKVKVLIGVVIVFCLAVCVSSSIQQDSKDIDSESLNIDKTGIDANREEIGIESSHDKNETSKSKKYDISILKRLEKDEDSTKQSQAKEDYSATVLVYIKPEYIENNKLKQNKRFNEVIENIAENLKSKGLRVTKNSANPLVVEISSFNELETLKNLGFVGYIRDGELPLAVPANSVLSGGVNKVNAPFTWDKGYNGAGTKIGVLDMGFSNWETLKSQGELPQNTYLYPPDGEGSGVHGSACAEICYDTAPGVSGLYLANEGLYTIDTLNAVKWLRNQGVDVISRSVGNFGWWPSQFDSNDDGESEFWDIYKIVEYAIDNNLVWVNGAGNNRDTHWEGSWKDNDSDGVLDFYKNGEDSAYIENDREQIQVTLEGGKEFYACVRWDDYPYPSNGPTNDFDVYLDCWIGGGWVTVDRSIYSQNGTFGQEPLEIIYYIPSFSGERDCALKVEKYDASNADLMHFDIWWGGQSGYWNYNDSSYEIVNETGSIIFPADHPNVISVGAVPWDDFTSLEHYSSIGPAYNPYLGVNGLIKPDLVAPDRVSTATYSGIFEGTSAAAPHVAGVAALLLSSNSSLTPADVKQKLEESADDLGVSGKDNYFGSGLVNASSATPFPPIPSFVFTPSNPVADEEIEFDASSSYDPDGQITSYEWDFGDGGTATGMTANHSYDSIGNYAVNLTLTDDEGLKNSKTRNIGVGEVNVSLKLWVDDDAGCGGNSPCYTSIQDAVAASSAGDTIIVMDGTYYENVNVDKRLIIRSENGSADCVVDAGDSGSAIKLKADGSIIKGLTATNSGSWGGAGIKVFFSNANIIINNTVSNNHDGIDLEGNNNNITNNIVSGNNYDGIDLEGSNNTITNNTISSNNDDGIYVWDSSNNTITNNTISSNNGDGISLDFSSNSTVTNNNVSSNNGDGISLGGLSNSTVTNNTFLYNGFGVYLWRSYHNIISDNCFSKNDYDGMYLESSHNNDIFNNHINGNKDDGITISHSSNNLFSNQIYNNSDKGILLGESIPENPLIKFARSIGYYEYSGGVLVGMNYNLYFDNLGGAGTVEFEASAGDSYDNETFYVESCRMYRLIIGVGLSYGSGTLSVSSSNATSSFETSLPGAPTSVVIKELVPLETHMCGNNITLNQVYNNQWGIYLNSSYNNLIYFNDFRGNSYNVESHDSDNMWNSTKQKAYTYDGGQYTSYVGNYWSDYTGVDGEEDGVGDTPYSINGDRDDYPLMQPFKNYFSEVDEPKITTIEVTPSTASLNETETHQFTAIAYDQFGNEMSDVSFTWSSSNTTVGTVDQNGLFAALNSGVTMVNATNGSVTGSAAVTVNVLHELTTIEVEPSSVGLDVGETHQFTAIAYDQFGNEMSDVSFTWSSSNTTVGTVNESGFFNALSSGTTMVNATNGSVTGSAAVTVNVLHELTTIKIDPPSASLDVGESKQFIATAYDQFDSEMPNVTFTWSSSNTTVGTLDQNGLFTPSYPGTTTVEAVNGSVTGSASVTVGYTPNVTTIEVSPSNTSLTAGEDRQFTATAYDQFNNEMPNVTFTWSSSNSTVGTVDENGLFTAITPGTTLVNATNGSVVGSAKVNVQRLNVTQFQCDGGSPGDEIQANVTLKNGGGPAWFVVKVTGVNNETGYPLAFGTGVVYLDQNDEVDIPLIVSLLPNLDEGTYELFVDVWEYGDHFNLSKIAFSEGPLEVAVSS